MFSSVCLFLQIYYFIFYICSRLTCPLLLATNAQDGTSCVFIENILLYVPDWSLFSPCSSYFRPVLLIFSPFIFISPPSPYFPRVLLIFDPFSFFSPRFPSFLPVLLIFFAFSLFSPCYPYYFRVLVNFFPFSLFPPMSSSTRRKISWKLRMRIFVMLEYGASMVSTSTLTYQISLLVSLSSLSVSFDLFIFCLFSYQHAEKLHTCSFVCILCCHKV